MNELLGAYALASSVIEHASLRSDPELRKVARRVVWFKPPEETLRDEVFFLNRAMVWGDISDSICIRRRF
ncbi:MAG: hypothetical protein OXF98_13460 [Rhodospirillaceae bacterium]|nr:hypothetical protein [Rhodospirillaceae bacterium]